MPSIEENLKESISQHAAVQEQQLQTLRDIIAPSAFEVDASFLKLGGTYARTLFVFAYPRYLTTNWLAPIINMGTAMDISLFIHPMSTEQALKKLQRQITNVEAELMTRQEKGLVRDPTLEVAYQNIEALRDKLQQAEERMFKAGLYITLYGDSLKKVTQLENEVRSVFESRMVYLKPALYQQGAAFNSTLPILLTNF